LNALARMARSGPYLFCCTMFVALGSHANYAADSKILQFYPPFSVIDIAGHVRQKQDELDVAQFHTSITVQYGTRNEWTNACSWLKAQTEDVMRFYKPPQNGSDEHYYFCGISRTDDEASVESLTALHNLIGELTRQFGGSIIRWNFNFHDHSRGQSDAPDLGKPSETN
jgi:hypothetical protein